MEEVLSGPGAEGGRGRGAVLSASVQLQSAHREPWSKKFNVTQGGQTCVPCASHSLAGLGGWVPLGGGIPAERLARGRTWCWQPHGYQVQVLQSQKKRGPEMCVRVCVCVTPTPTPSLRQTLRI